jgi:hypothetical protein
MKRARTSIDWNRVRAELGDRRVWVSLAKVVDVGFDPAHGQFADVMLLPGGENTTAMVSTTYAGRGFGQSGAPKVDDTVVLVLPHGDEMAGPVILGRLWSAADTPPADFGVGGDVAPGWRLRVAEGEGFYVRTAGAGTLDLKAEGSGDVLVVSTTGNLLLMDASQAFVRGGDYADALGVFLSALKTFLTALDVAVSALATATGLVPVGTTFSAATNVMKAAIDVFKEARTGYLSRRIKGQ